MTYALKVFIADDEPFARARLRQLLADCHDQLPVAFVGESADAQGLLDFVSTHPCDVVLLDINMPGMNGLEVAFQLRRLPNPPCVIFTTAHDEYALKAFDLAATDYILKPVRLERLLDALKRVTVQPRQEKALAQEAFLSVTERGRIILVPVKEVLYLKAELKYITIVTAEKEFLLEGALTQLESDYAAYFVRIHRNCLVHIDQLNGFERSSASEEEPHWLALLKCGAKLPVSRRQWQHLRGILK